MQICILIVAASSWLWWMMAHQSWANPTMPSMQGMDLVFYLLLHPWAASPPTRSSNESFRDACRFYWASNLLLQQQKQLPAYILYQEYLPSCYIYYQPPTTLMPSRPAAKTEICCSWFHPSIDRSVPFVWSYAPTRPRRREDYPFS